MESAIRKWHNLISTTTVGTAHGVVGDEGGPTLADYMEMFASATLHQQAYQAVVNALITDNVRWTDDPDRPVDQELYTFIETAVAHLMVTGFLVWRSHPDIGIEAASPTDMSIAMGTDGVWAPVARRSIGVATADAEGWQLGVMDQPVVDAAVYHEAVVDDRRLRSPVARAYAETIRVDHIQDHWLRRDMHNSRPAVWTTVAASIGNANGSTRPWFRGLGGAGTADRQVDPEVDFNALIHRRAETIAALDEATERDKARITAAEQQFSGVAMPESGRGAHVEHVVTDGREYKSTAALVTQQDGAFHYNRARQNVLALMGVPPQAIGESVNSERTAANHRQYEVAMATFGATVTKYRRVIAHAIEVATTQPNGAHVAFSPCLPHHDLVKLAPVLATDTYIDMLACSYRLPHDAFDPARVAEFQTATGGGRGGGSAPSIKTDADRGEATQQRALRNASA